MSQIAAAPADSLYQQAFLPDLLVAALEQHGDKPAMYLGDVVLTGRQVRDAMSRYVQAFAKSGVHAGSRTAMLSGNRPEVLFTMGATMVTGCRSSALHPLGSADDHAYVLQDAGVEFLIFDPLFTERAEELSRRVPGLTLFSLGPAALGTDLIALAEPFSPASLVPAPMNPEDVSGVTYTGGTTGKPKGVMSSYRGAATMTSIQMAEWEWPDEPRFLILTPLSHAAAAFFVPVLLRGGSIYVLPRFTPAAALEAIEQHKISATMVVPTILYTLMDCPDLATRDVSSLETVFYGAAPMSPTRLKEAIERFGPVFFQFYGQSECPMTITVLRKGDHDVNNLARLASCGRPVPWVHVALLDADGNEVPDGEPGEICVRGPLACLGYWNKPEETAALFANGWLHTGDVARRDDEGFLYIVDRTKDMIISGGFNIFPREVEDVLSAHPAVAAVSVIGVPDERWGEAVTAVVVLRPEASVEPDELIGLVKERKGSHHAPKRVDFVDALPLSPLGKPDKKALRAQYR